jgi:hypothetical protein
MSNHAHQFAGSASNLYPQIFVVRGWGEPLWTEPNQASSSVWRASVHHPESGQRWHFSQPTDLAAFLLDSKAETALLKDGFP